MSFGKCWHYKNLPRFALMVCIHLTTIYFMNAYWLQFCLILSSNQLQCIEFNLGVLFFYKSTAFIYMYMYNQPAKPTIQPSSISKRWNIGIYIVEHLMCGRGHNLITVRLLNLVSSNNPESKQSWLSDLIRWADNFTSSNRQIKTIQGMVSCHYQVCTLKTYGAKLTASRLESQESVARRSKFHYVS